MDVGLAGIGSRCWCQRRRQLLPADHDTAAKASAQAPSRAVRFRSIPTSITGRGHDGVPGQEPPGRFLARTGFGLIRDSRSKLTIMNSAALMEILKLLAGVIFGGVAGQALAEYLRRRSGRIKTIPLIERVNRGFSPSLKGITLARYIEGDTTRLEALKHLREYQLTLRNTSSPGA
jgi:hypothetical protein